MDTQQPKKNITVLSVVLLNILAILGLRWFSFAGEFGPGSVLIWVVAAFMFLIPMSFISAEFGAAHPDKEGAMTDWVKAELGEKCAFFTSWFYYISQIFFIPTMLTFVGIGVGYAINPQLAHSKLFITSFVIIVFWVSLFLTTKTLEIFKKASEIACLLGSIIPVIVLIAAALISVFVLKQKIPTDFSPAKWVPNFNLSNILFLVGIASGLGGSEISAPFISRMKNPQKRFPLAVFIATALIIMCYVLGSLSLILVIAPGRFDTSSGIFEVLQLVFAEIHMSFFANFVFVLMALGMLGSVILWLVSPAKMLIDGNDRRIFPEIMLKENADRIPINALIFLGILITFLILLSDLCSTVDAIYNVFVMAASVLFFLAYIFTLVAYIKMKFRIKTKLIFEMPGKKAGAVIAFTLAFIICLASIIIPLFSMPEGANIFVYGLEIAGVPVFFTVIGFLLYRRKEKNKW